MSEPIECWIEDGTIPTNSFPDLYKPATTPNNKESRIPITITHTICFLESSRNFSLHVLAGACPYFISMMSEKAAPDEALFLTRHRLPDRAGFKATGINRRKHRSNFLPWNKPTPWRYIRR
ncbi:hypothetical protein HYR99_25165 [Candidatus Poribacteria bacterium]|nr:hypothetical protein [Candidatus Poribacteria bacterium]